MLSSEKELPGNAGRKSDKVVMIGAGNVATHLSFAMKEAGFPIVQVYSRTKENARNLADLLNCIYTSDTEEIRRDADIYLFVIKDDVLPDIIRKIPENKGIWIHTAGSLPLTVFKGYADRYGVIYPLQTFSKRRRIEFHRAPLFIEGSAPAVQEEVRWIAGRISGEVCAMTSEKRKYLHLAAVFACNFSNHMYNIATRLIERQGVDRRVLQPLIEETASKLQAMTPERAQTGPAIRYDRTVMERHLALLEDPSMREIYKVISTDIYNTNRS
jgi:predicted short-subunit dehydrogenase-like oxidoreductase (DUF2520 family)